MKKTVPFKKILARIAPGIAFVSGIMAVSGANAEGPRKLRVIADAPAFETIVVNRVQGNKSHNIRLYPDARKQVLLISANTKQKKNYQFFMFDMDGKMVQHAEIPNRQTTICGKMAKGNYLFEIFSNDERIENGELTVR